MSAQGAIVPCAGMLTIGTKITVMEALMPTIGKKAETSHGTGRMARKGEVKEMAKKAAKEEKEILRVQVSQMDGNLSARKASSVQI